MDPLSATSIAACTIQFVDFSSKVISTTVQYRKSASGVLDDHAELDQVTRDLTLVCQKLDQSIAHEESQRNGSPPTPFQRLGGECQKVAAELLGALNKLKATNTKHEKWRSFRQALLAVYREGDIKALEARLGRFREQLTLRLLESLHTTVQESYVTNRDPVGTDSSNVAGIGAQILEHMKASKEWESNLKDMIYQATGKALVTSKPSLEPPSALKRSLELHLTQSLRFHEINDRHERIPKAIQDTFEWVYRAPRPGSNWASFIDWLKHENGIYWITGKPGSGKSTLMKFINNDERSTRALREWSGASTLVAAGFYFWNSGEQIQMSLKGLLQTLLHSVVLQRKELIPQLFPHQWEAVNLFGKNDHDWLWTECLEAIRKLADPIFSKYKFFFLVDGLDEFEGDHNELISIFHELSQASHIKLCVSSREWVVFQDAFSKRPSLLLQSLTAVDIQIFVRKRFDNHEGFDRMRKREGRFASELLGEVARRSSGVFLWVRLVVQSLLSGISNGDRMSDLRRRLDDLPQDLESLFRKIFESMDRFYRGHASQLFQIHRAYGPMSGLRFSFADEEDDSLWKAGKHKPLGPDDIVYRVEQMKRRIDSRTKGLLEMDNWRKPTAAQPSQPQSYNYVAVQCQVQYLHRTVKDFIETETLWKDVILSATPGFDPHLSLLKAMAMDIMTWDRQTSGPEHLDTSIVEALCLASAVHPESRLVAIEVLDALEEAVSEIWTDSRIRALLPSLALSGERMHLLPLALRLDLHWWLKHLLGRGLVFSSTQPSRPYLFFTVDRAPFIQPPKSLEPPALNTPSLECMRLLVESGASIYSRNEEEMPLWKHIRFEFMAIPSSTRYESKEVVDAAYQYWSKAVEKMVLLGADPRHLDNLFPRLRGGSYLNDRDVHSYWHETFRRRCEEITSSRFQEHHLQDLSPRVRVMQRLKRRRNKQMYRSLSGSAQPTTLRAGVDIQEATEVCSERNRFASF